jgi:hypothetical protein
MIPPEYTLRRLKAGLRTTVDGAVNDVVPNVLSEVLDLAAAAIPLEDNVGLTGLGRHVAGVHGLDRFSKLL